VVYAGGNLRSILNDRMSGSNQFRLSLFLCIVGILFLQVALAFSTSDRVFLWHNDHRLAVTRVDAPLLFRITPVVTSMLGVLALAMGLAVFSQDRRGETRTRVCGQPEWSPFYRKLIWRTVNILVVLYSPFTGYSRMSPAALHGTNPDGFYCLAILLLVPLCVLGTLAISPAAQFTKPSWDRFPLRLWRDPLQFFFLATWASLGVAMGSLLRFPRIWTVGFWTLLSHLSIFVGLLIGQAIAYWAYRDRITSGGKGRS